MGIAEIVEVLGGSQTFQRPVLKAEDLIAEVRSGFPASTVSMLATTLSMHRSLVAERLNIPSRTLSRRLATNSPLTLDESDRTLRMARVVALANEVLGAEDKAQRWMAAPNRALGGKIPFDELDTEMGVRSVESVLYAIAYGMYS
ncbi:MAG: antitoxin Xre/MbcA/ParS toxin-binding domain-containing protein [Terracidiphilus sp.]